jgi:hypothetical protein
MFVRTTHPANTVRLDHLALFAAQQISSKVACQCQTHIRCDGINRFALGTSIRMIDAVTLVMAMQQSSTHQVRYRSANICPAGSKDTRLNLLILLLSKIVFGFRGFRLCQQLRADRCNHSRTTTVAIGQRCQRLAEPVAYRNMVGFASDIRSKTAILSRGLRDQIEDQQHISRTFRHLRNALDKIWQRYDRRRDHQLSWFNMVKEIGLVEHTMNLAQAIPLRIPLNHLLARKITSVTLPAR